MPHFLNEFLASSYQPSFSLKVEQILSVFLGGSVVQAGRESNNNRINDLFIRARCVDSAAILFGKVLLSVAERVSDRKNNCNRTEKIVL